ncbi:MAG: FAD-binding oxidoreductase [Chloroflexi bacterium]|nr:FAD-binding oxidoreductase [Chloroflexota bacterium]
MSSSAPPEASPDLEPALRKILGERLSSGDAAYTVDGLAPRLVASPASADELAAVLAATNDRRGAAIPWGGGRHMALGNPPRRYDIALETRKLDRVIEYEPADLTVTVEAGVSMGRLQALLLEQRQFLPIDAPDDATAGGLLAAGVAGPSAHAYGLARDWLLGCRIAQADGTISKGGGRVVKNVAGYDLPRLAVGSLGTLGVIVEATFKLAPLPATQKTLLIAHRSLEPAAEAIARADERSIALRAVALLSGSAAAAQDLSTEAVAAFWLAGPASAVERTAGELRDLAGNLQTRQLAGDDSVRWWTQIEDTMAVAEEDALLRASLPPSAAVDLMRQLEVLSREAGANAASLAYPTVGLVIVRLAGVPAERLAELIAAARLQVEAAAGSLVVAAAPPAVKQRIDVWPAPEDTVLDLMQRLKREFDPNGTISPGRFAGGI